MFEQIEQPKRHRWGLFTLFAGIILPAISILVETTTHICAEEFFDPIPTTWHVLLVVFVPLAHLQVWLAIRRGNTERGALLGLANAVAIGISLFYTIVYLPLLPLAVIALLFGLGILPMAPIFALISGIIMRRQLRRISTPGFSFKVSGLMTGMTLAFAAIVLMDIPATLTRYGLQMAASPSPSQSAKGIRWLRAVGDRDYLLRVCYGRTGKATDLVGYLLSLQDPVTPEEARNIYYRITGETFNTQIPPKRVGGRFIPQDRFDFDPDQGGTVIAGKVKNLSLAGSRLDGTVDADAGLGYIEWTLVFKNDSTLQQEARAQVQLPPGAVVSRLTLWVNGEEREAAFAGRSQTRAAYQNVVRQRRDPVLVTTAGRDRILVQCFPVPAGSGEMKIRFGITTPLILESRAEAVLRLPYLLDRNFGIPNQVTHAIWLESKKPLQTASEALRAEQPVANLYAVRGALRETELSSTAAAVRLTRAGEITESWTLDSLKGEGEIVRQFIEEKESRALSRIVLVVDTSRAMRSHAKEIAAALRTLPPNVELKLVLADGNGIYEAGTSQRPVAGNAEDIARQLETVTFDGGADNVPALTKAWDLAAESSPGAIVWIHGPQPLLLLPVEELRQRPERRPAGPTLYTVQTENGPNRIEEKLDGIASVKAVARLNRLELDLEILFAQLTGQRKPLRFVRTSEKLSQPPAVSTTVKETSSHLARLWAKDEVERLMTTSDEKKREEAVLVAARYQLVTPVSGAVVLETREQYQQAGLTPVEAGSVPTIPEPETVLLMVVVALIFLYMLYRQRGARWWRMRA